MEEVLQIVVSKKWGRSVEWFRRMMALMVALGFVTLMRLDEVRRLLLSGIRFRIKTGEELSFQVDGILPRLEDLVGVLVLVVWRKAGQDQYSWIPVSCKVTIGLLLEHLQWICARGVESDVGPYLFPSRVLRKRVGYQVTMAKVGDRTFRTQFRAALSEACGISACLLPRFGGHSLRIGGSNWMRKVGLSDRIHRLMGGWASLTSSADYMQLSVAEQFDMTSKFALSTKRQDGPVSGGSAIEFTQVAGLQLGGML